MDVSTPGSDSLRRAAATFGVAGDPDGFVGSGLAIAFVSIDGDELTGWCYGYHLPRPDGTAMAYLHSIDVDEAHRRRGIGRELLDAFLAEAKLRGATKSFLTTGRHNEAARRLYQTAGGQLASQGPTENYWFDLSTS